jgi:cytochrome P450
MFGRAIERGGAIMDGLPAGPRNALLQSVLLTRDNLGYLTRCVRRYGDPFTVPMLHTTYVITGDPEEARRIFTADPEMFGPSAGDEARFLIGDGAFPMLDGEHHLASRRLLAPPFHGARMRTYGRIMADAAMRELGHVPSGAGLKAQDTGQAISLDVILEAAFGVSDPERKAKFRRSIIELLRSSSGLLILLRPLQREFGGFGPFARFRRRKRAFDALVFEELAQRRQIGSDGPDILHMMMAARRGDGSAMSDDELRDQLFFLLLAGHETSAVSLAWALYELHRSPAALDRLRAEIDALGPDPAPDALAALPYLDAVCQETLRLHPLLGFVPRRLRQPFELRGYRLPAGVQVGVGIGLVHGREDLYPEPARFRPERFLERKFSPFEFLPFGGGTRRCLGAAFALYEMKIVLATILHHHRLTLLEPGPVRHVLRSGSLGAETGIRMRLDGRRVSPPRTSSGSSAQPAG